jgi:hypothetical protein
MANYIIFEENGNVLGSGSCPTGEELNQVESGYFILISNDDFEKDIYVDMNLMEIKNKTEMSSIINKEILTADGIDEIIITNLYNLTKIILNKLEDEKSIYMGQYEITDGSFEISLEDAGVYKITLSSVPFLDKEYMITAI